MLRCLRVHRVQRGGDIFEYLLGLLVSATPGFSTSRYIVRIHVSPQRLLFAMSGMLV